MPHNTSPRSHMAAVAAPLAQATGTGSPPMLGPVHVQRVGQGRDPLPEADAHVEIDVPPGPKHKVTLTWHIGTGVRNEINGGVKP